MDKVTFNGNGAVAVVSMFKRGARARSGSIAGKDPVSKWRDERGGDPRHTPVMKGGRGETPKEKAPEPLVLHQGGHLRASTEGRVADLGVELRPRLCVDN